MTDFFFFPMFSSRVTLQEEEGKNRKMKIMGGKMIQERRVHRGLLSSCRCISQMGPVYASLPPDTYFNYGALKMTQVQQVFKT